jgi:hypothetical protein
LELSDEIMADRGFTITEELLLRHAKLHIPPGKRGQEQFCKAKVKKKQRNCKLKDICRASNKAVINISPN